MQKERALIFVVFFKISIWHIDFELNSFTFKIKKKIFVLLPFNTDLRNRKELINKK